ncbi:MULTISPECIES: BCCT family transporter [unclassified Oceanobacter]|jgi:choline/glycine/proline betaine transport protein|uniref:BCCT family transporter n=1 Tax=unclassified Oceanobacter TaxID=2620260 RepID=UPI0026E2827A|nr:MULTISPECIES: BCCT family transporter [unclassified Oceanobacter]MDO6683097.1 BCCT family transporter [Oceanobacter sp. 5_MG-2023]MDP2505904.1 BCCT family transporter [Oceanobacter sp. 3_MG-2023]
MQPKKMLVSKGLFAGIHPGMGIASKAMILAFVLFTVLNVDLANGVYTDVKSWIQTTLNWYYVMVVSVVLFFCVWMAFSRHGSIRLGADDERPAFSFFVWFSMLFSCAIGVGILFWSIAEPIFHLQGNPFIEMAGIEPGSAEAAQVALRITLFHWGLHGWAVYIATGMMIAYFACRRGLPMTIRSTLYPLLGDRIYGPLGHAVDLLAIFSTLFGTATALGLGVSQINAGLNYLFGVEISTTVQVVLIAVISIIATLSTMSGLERGIRWLSVWNIRISLVLIGFFVIAGPTVYLLGMFTTSVGDYVWHMIPMGFWTDPNPEGQWQGWWTLFYWGWWLSWGPLVGLFIARISRGRTIREFLLSALIIPPLGGFIWIIAMGGTALHIELYGAGGIVEAVNADMTMALYHTIEAIGVDSLTWPMSLLATIMIITWFVTSADSGTLVISTILSMGSEPSLAIRGIWGTILGAVAAVLLLAGGLTALQSATIAAALPFSVVLLLMCVALIKGLRDERDGISYGPGDLAQTGKSASSDKLARSTS